MGNHYIDKVPRTSEVNVDIRSLFGISVEVSGFTDSGAADENNVLNYAFDNGVVTSEYSATFDIAAREEVGTGGGKFAANSH